MATTCKQCKCWEEHFYWNHFETTRLHFGKVMDGHFSEHMIIPKKFVKNFKEELPQTIQLKGPSGNLWHVRLLNIAGDTIMTNGWKQFVKDHCIKEDDYLVFKYEGNARFNVLILDETGCERESSYFVKNSINKANEPCQLEPEVAEDSLEILHESPKNCKRHSRNCCNKREQKPQFSGTCKYPQVSAKIDNKKLNAKSSHFKRQGRDDELSFISVSANDQMSRPTKAAKYTNKKNIQSFLTRRPIIEEEKARVLQKANALQLTNPFFIKVIMASHVSKNFFLTIPSNFAAEHVRSTQQNIFLRLPKGKKRWHATNVVCKDYSGLGSNWRHFAQDNHLEEGDVCVFELKRATEELVMVVHIFRASDEIAPAKRDKRDD